MKRLLFSALFLLVLSSALWAGEKRILSRTLQLDFKHPGRVLNLGGQGAKPVSEKVAGHSYILVMPKNVKLTLSILDDNPDTDHYLIWVRIIDQDRPAEKSEKKLKQDKVIQNYWIAQYRYQFTTIQKQITNRGRFVTALIKLDVYGPR